LRRSSIVSRCSQIAEGKITIRHSPDKSRVARKSIATGRTREGGGPGPMLDHDVEHIKSEYGPFTQPAALPMLRNNGPFLSRAMPVTLIQAINYASSSGWQAIHHAATIPCYAERGVAGFHCHGRADPRKAIDHHP
jgi:hypothetical protein